jgi:PhzF family phenazine biosynthesis protein
LCIEVEQRHTLTTIVPDHQAITTLSAHFELVGFYVFARKARGEVVEARMFAPHYGIPEESATGMAAGALALLLHQAEGIRNLIIEQGHLMQPPSPALLMTEIDAKSRVLVSGAVIEA